MFVKSKQLLAALVLACTALGVNAATVEVAGIKFEDTVKLGGTDLRLNGAGIRYKAIFKVYAAGLYIKEKKSTMADILALPGPKRVTLHFLRDVSNEDFGRGFMEGLKNNTDRAERAKFVGQYQRFGDMFATIPELKKGDTIHVDWVPGSGTTLLLNGKRVIEPDPDPAFYNALLRIWLGEKPVDTSLRKAMLAEPPKVESDPYR
ncbi:MAG: chalcone isomerase family protein [Burkholderiaceae bacterium]|nr:chalcone isomerase family protein [Burkholderiaceae bacterium]